MTVAFHDLRRQAQEIEDDLRRALDETLAESRFVGGRAIEEFERAWAAFCGIRHAVGCGSGADAVALALRALGVGPGDEVVAPANTCVPTIAGIVGAGATPVLADVDPRTLTLDPQSASDALTPRTRALVPVHLYGRCADMEGLCSLARERGLVVVEDAAHAHGATWRGRRAGSLGDAAAFSFYPTKNLGALGDAGVVTTDDPAVADRLRAARGFGLHGPQSRLDTVQAALLLAKLPHLERWNARRRELADRYRGALRVEVPPDDDGHVYHLFVARVPERDRVRRVLADRGVETAVHYAPAIHRRWPSLAREGALAASERAAETVLSLPLYPQLSDDEVDEVIASFAGV